MMRCQFWWPDWWKLYPRFEKELANDFDEPIYYDNYFFFGPLQCRWYSF